nr:MAG TPA: hypothetical protein [Caudoviricetes sp.]
MLAITLIKGGNAKNKIKLDSGERKGVMQGHGSTGRIE